MINEEVTGKLKEIFGEDRVITGSDRLEEFSSDMTENEAHSPDVAVVPKTVEEIQALVRLANETGTPLIPRVAGTNLGGIAIPVHGGIVLDLRKMNRIVEMNTSEMYVIVEPGVTFGDIRKFLDENHPELTIGYPLSPPETSILCNAILDGLTNLSFPHGAMGEWINGLEAVLPTGEMIRTGAGALSPKWFAKAPLPDLTGLFISWQGTTGIVTKLAIQLWPQPAIRKRMFLLTYDLSTTFSILREISRKRIFDDIGCLSWTTGKLLFSVKKPMYKDPSEPESYIYIDISAETKEELKLKFLELNNVLKKHNIETTKVEPPIEIKDLVKINPTFGKFADFPTTLDFLTDHGGGGLTWVGSYGPVSAWEDAVRKGTEIMLKKGFPPTHVNRPMKGGHYCIMRFITIFNKEDKDEIERVKDLNRALLDVTLEHGFIPYKTPAWVVEKIKDRLDPGFVKLFTGIKKLIDPNMIMNPGKWQL